jgi:hypothetical protein
VVIMSSRRRSALPILVILLALVAAGAVLAIRLSGDEPAARPAAKERVEHPVSRAGETEPALWPFRTREQARRWQVEQAPDGHSPWHADAEATALAFTTGYLGFTELDTVVFSEIGGTEAVVEVGYLGENGKPTPAGALRLVRFGGGPDAPWEVVGTLDDAMSVTEPAPGAEITSPVRVGGRISGVDESIRVQVHDPAAPRPIGQTCCEPAGGENTPWSASVDFRGASGAALTIVASTGGHVADVERFAITGARPAA